MVIFVRRVRALSLVLAAGFLFPLASAAAPIPENAGDLYRLTNVWSIHLKFDPAEWEAMQPKGGGGGFPPFGRGPGGPGGPRFGGPPAASMLVPLFLRDGDQNT